ncbi:ParA family protein [Bradyrhizobium lablabi]|uniref:ParA family protein n=1 Tax=Bradyrhizobium lablabi TaxID=722472 RepID=UPI001BA917E4|nr:ParA family protein [Bradyrhizobium lablabi]MBR1126242.1 ParA family protein [Bradyrhizobium lablabi]
MHTIVLATHKGGSGKSTLAVGLALAAMEAGHVVRLIETCQLGTLSHWQGRRADAEKLVEPVYAAGDIAPRLAAIEDEGVTLAIVDTAAAGAATTSAIRLADLCLIPARPSIADIEATALTLRELRAANAPFAFVLNQTPIRGQRISTAAGTLGGSALDIPDVVAQPFIAMRNDHQDALRAGLAVSEYAPESKAAEEIRGLWNWIEERLGLAVVAGREEAASDLPIVSISGIQAPAEAARFI